MNAPITGTSPAGSESYLPLTAFESLMWQDQRASWPMTFSVQADFSGCVDRRALQIASNTAVSRHPLLHSTVERRSRQWQWHLAAKKPPEIIWQDASGTVNSNAWSAIDLRQECGIRLLVQTDEERSRLFLVVHHATCDGIGALNFLGDLLATYHGLVAGIDYDSLQFNWDVAGMAHRGDIAWGRRVRPPSTNSPPPTPIPRSAILSQALEFLTLSPLRLAPRSIARGTGGPSSTPEPPFVRALVPAPDVHRLREIAQSKGAQLNDLLLREMVLTILAWQTEQTGAPPRRGAFRITMPVNLRSEGHRRIPAANILSYGFVHSRRAEWTDPQALLESIAFQTRAIVDQGWAEIFLTGLTIAQQVPGLLPIILTLSRSFSTLVFSNVGEVVRRMRFRPPLRDGRLIAGGLILEQLTAVPPVRPGTRLAMAATIYNGMLGLSTLGCPQTVGRQGAEIFQQLFVQRLLKLAATTVQSTTVPSTTRAESPTVVNHE